MSEQPPVPPEKPSELRDAEENLMKELVKLRKKQKMGQEPIAKATGLTQARVSQMENLTGGVTLEAVLSYARAIGANIVVVPDSSAKKKQ